jgi:hypothetical protein
LASSFFGANFILLGNIPYAILSFATIGGLSSFSIYNVYGKANKIFMGDTGSLLLGLLLAVFAIEYNEITLTLNDQQRDFSPILSLAILAVPLFDMVRLFTIRIIQNKSPFSPDINHIHHKLLKIDLSHQASTLIILTANLVLIGIVYLCRSLNNNISLFILISIVVFFTFIPRFVYEYKKAKNRRSYLNIQPAEKNSDFNLSEYPFIDLPGKAKAENQIPSNKPKIGVRM